MGFLRSALARFRRPAPAEPPRRPITTAEAWDLWRAASCDERGGHWWKVSKPLGRDDHTTFTCGHCPATVDVYPVDGEIRTPWGVTAQVVTRVCKFCDIEFRQAKYSDSSPQEYCCKRHSTYAWQKRSRERTRPERMAAHEALLQAQQQTAREGRRRRNSLAACAEKDKVRYEDKRTADLAAGRYEREFGGHRYPYECDCGSWHLTKLPPGAVERAEALKRALFGESEMRAG